MATTLHLIRKGRALYPADGLAEAELHALPHAKRLKAVVTQPRSIPQNNLYFGALALVADNCDFTKEQLHMLVKFRLGYSQNVQLKDGSVCTLHGSVAFDKMGGPEFNAFLDKAEDFLCNEVCPGLGKEELREQVREMFGLGEAA